jgi:general stress protein CsbA
MKKSVIVFGAILMFASCKKDWTCSCSINGVDAGSFIIADETKKKAKDECDEGDTSISLFGAAIVSECEIN